MTAVSFMSANDFARVSGYALRDGWHEATAATSAWFEPIATFPERFDELLARTRGLGFGAVDLWQAHLDWCWATPLHIAAAREALARHGLVVASLAGNFGDTVEALDAACRLAVGVGTTILGGRSPLFLREPEVVETLLERYDLRLGIENHGDHSPASMRALVEGRRRVGTTLDTGWYLVLGHDVPEAIAMLAPAIVHVHLKDVSGVGDGEGRRLGAGSLPVVATLDALERVGYHGRISIELEFADRDPGEDARAALELVRGHGR